MKTFNTRTNPSALSLLTLAVVALVHGGASAAASENDLKNTTLYGSVSIAEDNVESWGPWTNFEPPAAGPDAVGLLPQRAVDLYRPLAQPESTPEPFGLGCAGGSLCGFGAYTRSESIKQGSSPQVDSYSVPFAVLLDGPVTTVGGNGLPQAIRLFTTPLLPGVTALMPDSGELPLTVRGNTALYGRFVNTPAHTEVVSVSGLSVSDLTGNQVSTGAAAMMIGDYVQGASPEAGRSSAVRQELGPVVLGFTTTDADMAALRASNAVATYNDAAKAIRIDVQFGSGSWTGSWNNGKDGNIKVAPYPMPAGQAIISGAVGFTAQGIISGVNIKSTSVGTADTGATVSGYVQGAFFGPKAAAIGGVVDITKTKISSVSSPAAVAPQPASYTAGKYMTTFIAVR